MAKSEYNVYFYDDTTGYYIKKIYQEETKNGKELKTEVTLEESK